VRTRIVEPLVRCRGALSAMAPLRKLRSYVEQATVPLPERLETYNLMHRFAAVDLFEAGFLQAIDREEPYALLREVYGRARAQSALNRMLFLDWKFTLADNDLRKVVRSCELAQVEARFPLLDDEVVDFSLGLAPGLKVRNFKLRYFFKRALRDFLPREVLAKSKHGFGLPFGIWLERDPALRELARDNLSSFAHRGIVRPEFVGRLMQAHARDHAAYYGVLVWVLIMLEQWYRIHGSRAASP
jgi:asparagine synthase (glutamine-hydrolysing)